MGRTQCGEYANGRLDDIAQSKHLSGLRDTCLEDTHLRLLVEQPYREGHTYLGVIATRRTYNLLRGQQQLIEPLLHHGLTIRTRDTHDGYIELVAMTLSQSLQGSQRRWHYQEIGILI